MSNPSEPTVSKPTIQHLNPDGMHSNPAYTQAVVVSGPAKTIYIGMQNAVDAAGNVVGPGDLARQTEQTLKNVEMCLAAAGAGLEHLIQMTIYIAQGQEIRAGFEVFQRWWGNRPNPPTNNGMLVAGLLPPVYLIGVSAIAVAPE